ncbi:hypothetical protein GWK47_008070 [Chionoecetes opilio]|uniref:Endonuclease/exonuclease/phosphatase domain-containing protein n=1 Tax=Chionoecetes opilio TaxID=41210 RepID=A0A8J4Y9K2_CHIOP|nr:hypothetical protein GWK47_008070 [Chionoecetes opilio]
MVRPERPSHKLEILSANVRGLRTNIGDLTHNCVLRYRADVVVVTETWLNIEVEPTFGKMHVYTQWTRMDHPERAGGGVAVCYKEGVQAQHLDVVPSPHMEVLFFRVVLADRPAILLCAMYRPPRQGPASLQYLTGALDDLMLEHRCRHVLVVGDLNHHLEQHAYESLQTVQGLTDNRRHVPHRDYTTKPTDQPWCGYRCRLAAEAKYSAWLRYKRNPTQRNKDLHRAACRRMVVSSKWTMKK